MNIGAALAATAAGAVAASATLALVTYARRDAIEASVSSRAVRWVSARVGLPELNSAGQLALRLLR